MKTVKLKIFSLAFFLSIRQWSVRWPAVVDESHCSAESAFVVVEGPVAAGFHRCDSENSFVRCSAVVPVDVDDSWLETVSTRRNVAAVDGGGTRWCV